jgi:hypothetical protein
MRQPFTFPDLTGRKVLVLGLGGGGDVILAYALGRLLPVGARSIIYANTKKHDEKNAEFVTPHIRRLVGPVVPPRGRTHGTWAIERSIPRGDDGCPWVFVIENAEAEQALVQEIIGQKFDIIFGVDTGGDSLAARSNSGRDKRMLRILRQTGIPLFHVVVAPGSDGECSTDNLRWAMNVHNDAGRYRGCLELAGILDLLRELSAPLGSKRTPRIILSAAAGELKEKGDGRLIVPRGSRPAVPRDWLLRAFVFV